ncbi:MAG TPA: tetratricopeptide repeat protein, partial [Phycisphaerae bacterium]|nr:tetratricopeptide repeat protein [Phycisphaerae bacterium]
MRMPEKSKIQVSSICLIATLFCVFSPTSTAASKPWEAAAEVYNASLKLYKLNQWQDALAALQGFVEDFPTNENVPLAYLQIASCYNFMHKDDEELKILEKITKEFPDTMAAFYAWSTIYYDKFKKAQEVKSQAESGKFSKEFKDFVLFLENMEKQFGGLFIAPINQIHWPVISDYYWHYSPGRITWWPYYEVLGYEIELYPLNGWNYWTTRFPDQRMTQSILTLAKNPAMAEELLRVLQPCFRKLDDDLPACWKMMHVQLL